MANSNSTEHGPRFIDLTGQKFGRWTVLEFHSIATSGNSLWLCRCACGTEKPIEGCSMSRGDSHGCKSCSNTSHGKKDTPEYAVWCNMRDRCQNAQRPDYVLYGGRGITVCERWQKSFESFFEDMGPRPSPQHSIDRIDNDNDYCLENCRWATLAQQARNKRSNRMLTHNGQTMCLTDWAETLDINIVTLHSRLKSDWSVERALTTPARAMKHKSR